IVLAKFEKRLQAGKTILEAMAEPIYQEAYLRPLLIKKVVCFTAFSAEEATPIEKPNMRKQVEHPKAKQPIAPLYKYLRSDGYAYMEIIKSENGFSEVVLVGVQEGMAQKGKHAPLGVTRYYKGDVVEDLTTGKKYRIKKFAASDGKNPRPTMITLAWTESVDDVTKVKQSAGRMDFFKERLMQIRLLNQSV
ncbi:MAG: hypothetical protein H0W85_10865, partial [Methylotenera sp.]|nr:hypothetical protein [Methylotenera sp.]